MKDKEDIKMETEFKRFKWNLLAKNEYSPVSFKKIKRATSYAGGSERQTQAVERNVCAM